MSMDWAVLRILIRKDLYNFPGSGSPGSVSISYSSEHNKLNWKGKI
jgi:hypothetical protein